MASGEYSVRALHGHPPAATHERGACVMGLEGVAPVTDAIRSTPAPHRAAPRDSTTPAVAAHEGAALSTPRCAWECSFIEPQQQSVPLRASPETIRARYHRQANGLETAGCRLHIASLSEIAFAAAH